MKAFEKLSVFERVPLFWHSKYYSLKTKTCFRMDKILRNCTVFFPLK